MHQFRILFDSPLLLFLSVFHHYIHPWSSPALASRNLEQPIKIVGDDESLGHKNNNWKIFWWFQLIFEIWYGRKAVFVFLIFSTIIKNCDFKIFWVKYILLLNRCRDSHSFIFLMKDIQSRRIQNDTEDFVICSFSGFPHSEDKKVGISKCYASFL